MQKTKQNENIEVEYTPLVLEKHFHSSLFEFSMFACMLSEFAPCLAMLHMCCQIGKDVVFFPI